MSQSLQLLFELLQQHSERLLEPQMRLDEQHLGRYPWDRVVVMWELGTPESRTVAVLRSGICNSSPIYERYCNASRINDGCCEQPQCSELLGFQYVPHFGSLYRDFTL